MGRIETGRFSEGLRRLLNMKSNEGPVDIAPEMVGVFALENDRPEWGIHKGEKWCQRGVSQAVGAGFSSKIKFRNPAGSGVIAIFHRLVVCVPTAITSIRFRCVLSSVDYATATARAIAMDTRFYENAQVAALSAVITSRQATDAVDADSGFGILTIPAAVPVEAGFGAGGPRAILAPGYALEIQCSTVAIALEAWATWTERGMTKAEERT